MSDSRNRFQRDKKMLTKVSGKEEKDESTGFCRKLSNRSFAWPSAPFATFSQEDSVAESLRDFGGSSFPCFLSHPRMGGSFPSAHETSTPAKPRSDRPLAHTAANASPICLKGTRAVAFFGGFVGVFFGGFMEMTMDDSSTSPKRESWEDTEEGVVNSGRVESDILSLTVVSRWPRTEPISLDIIHARTGATHQVAERHPPSPRSHPDPLSLLLLLSF